MVYVPTTWVASTAPGISATNLNNLETQYTKSIVIGEIKLYGGTTAPTDFFLCNGTSKEAAVYPALFAVTSHYYGGDATWFHLPNLMGKFPAGYSTDAGSTYGIGLTGGTSEVTMATSQMPAHVHSIPIYAGGGAATVVSGGVGAAGVINSNSAGGGEAHENRPPYVVVNYIIRYQ